MADDWMRWTSQRTLLSKTGIEYELCETREVALDRAAATLNGLMRPPLSMRVDKAIAMAPWREFCDLVFRSMFIDPTRQDLMLAADAACLAYVEAQRWSIEWDDVIGAVAGAGSVQ